MGYIAGQIIGLFIIFMAIAMLIGFIKTKNWEGTKKFVTSSKVLSIIIIIILAILIYTLISNYLFLRTIIQ